MHGRKREWWIIPFLAFIPLLLYIGIGYRGNDYKYHVTSWLQLYGGLKAHEWTLGWSDGAQYGFGEPRFCFYPPLSIMIGAGLMFLMPLKLVPGAVVWLLLTLSGLFMYVVAMRFLPTHHRLSAAVLYMFNPYLIITIFVRWAIAEAWVEALLPILFLFMYQALVEHRWRLVIPLALLFSFAWLSNIPEALVLFYGAGALAIVLAVAQQSWQPLLVCATSQVLAVGLAAFRLLPALAEKGWVFSNALLFYNYRETMQFMRLRPHLIDLACGIDIAVAYGLLLLALRQHVRAEGKWSSVALSLFALATLAVFFQVPVSIPLWEYLPEAKFISFPFRFLPLLSFGSVLLLFSAGVTDRLRRAGIVLLAAASLFPLVPIAKLHDYERFPSFAAALSTWQRGFEGVREYVPSGVPYDPAKLDLIHQEMAQRNEGPFHAGTCAAALTVALPNEKVVQVHDAFACSLTLNTFYYPFWNASLEDGTPIALRADAGGLMTFSAPAGSHALTFRFHPASRLRTVSAQFSLGLGVILMLLLLLTGPSTLLHRNARIDL
jgi:hypothetical protein